MGDGVTDVTTETGTVDQLELSPEDAAERAIEDSGMFILATAAADPADRPAIREAVTETIREYFDDSPNTMPMEYLLTTATVV